MDENIELIIWMVISLTFVVIVCLDDNIELIILMDDILYICCMFCLDDILILSFG
jgi:hypothetical protein